MAADLALRFVPERVTQLFYAPLYSELTSEQRLRYNQLYAAHINEQFSYFEGAVGNPVSAALLHGLERRGLAGLAARVRAMIDDEERHLRLFNRFNSIAFPALYAHGPHCFIRPSPPARLATALLTRFAARLPFMVWIALFFEEFSVYLSSCVLSEACADSPLHPAFVELHRQHLRDEERHVRLYPELIRAVVGGLSARQRRLHGRLLKWVIRELLAPKRSGIAVVHQLAREFTALAGREAALASAVRALKNSPRFFEELFGPSRLPVMHAMFREFPEFAWKGYRD